MNLEQEFGPKDPPAKQTISEKIRQRRAQMLVHSYIYYEKDDCIVDDFKWQQWADELVVLQKEYPADIGFYDKEFEGWTGAGGSHLPLRDPNVMKKGETLLKLNEKK
jgi:hypothetical protein|tara:strand:- start:41 stop:361 length:321 start_codon:yes stop_codon:yes gene_type:complete